MDTMKDTGFDLMERLKKLRESNPLTDEQIDKMRDEREGIIAGESKIEARNFLNSRIPEKYHNSSLKNWIDDTLQRRSCKNEAMKIMHGDILQMWCGPTGTGKTFLGYCLQYEFVERSVRTIHENWHYISSLLSSHETIDIDGLKRNPTAHMMNYNRFKLMIVDDYNSADMDKKQFMLRGLFELIKMREARRLKTVIISNMTYEALVKSFGEFWDMIDSRMNGKGGIINFKDCGEWNQTPTN